MHDRVGTADPVLVQFWKGLVVAYALRAEPGDEGQPARCAVGIETLGQCDRVFRGERRAELHAERVGDVAGELDVRPA